ncbi:MAG: hypothetical protein ACO2O0_10390 [Desulfurococcales archaeon]
MNQATLMLEMKMISTARKTRISLVILRLSFITIPPTPRRIYGILRELL